MSQQLPPRVLIVDDDLFFVRMARAALEGTVELRTFSDRDAAVEAAESWAPDVVVVDVMMGDAGAFGLLDEMRERCHEGIPRVLYLAKGPGSIHRLQSDDGSFLGVIRRESGIEGLISAVTCALGSIAARSLLIA